ncbi:retrotransposon protein, putative, ty1-copia subclass [Tanacetum coccineum]
MGYYFYFPPENIIVVARYAEFFEKNLKPQEVSGRAIDLEEIQNKDTSPFEITSKIPMEVEGFEPPQEEVIPIHRSERTHRAPNRLCLNVKAEEHSLGDLNEPTSYKATMLDSESNKWIDVMNAEIQSMIDNMVWVLVDLPPNSHLVAKGYTQLYEVDYEETFSPVADIRAIRILISIAAFYDYEIWQMDVKTAFLNGYLDEDIYMVQPEGFVDPNHPRKASGSNVTFLILYIDDIIIMGNHILSLQSVKDYLGKCFAMKDLEEVAFILGIKIYRDRSKRLIGLGQNAYMDKILKRYKMDNSKRGHIPIQERLDLNKTQGASTPKKVKRMKNVPYASAVGSITYAVRCTRPDVAFAQNITSRFQQNPGEERQIENFL